MATEVGSIYYDLDLDSNKFDAGMNKASNRFDSMGKEISQVGDKFAAIGKTMTMAVTLPIVAGLGLAIKSASDLNETINKVDVAFKDQADTVKSWANTSIKNMGLAKQSALDAAALFGDMGTSMGLTTKEASKMSMGMVQLGADLASFKNIPIAQAQTALAGIFTGETESLKQLGIVMTEQNLNEFARAQGIEKTTQQMTQQEKVQLRYNYIMSVTTNAQGDFIRTQSGAANQTRMFQENIKELSATFGQVLLPKFTEIVNKINEMLVKFGELDGKTQNAIVGFLGFAAAIGPVMMIVKPLGIAIGAVITGFQTLGAIFAAFSVGGATAGFAAIGAAIGPVGWIMLAIAAIAAIAVLVYKNWDAIKTFFIGMWQAVSDAFTAAVTWIGEKLTYLKDNFWSILGFIIGFFATLPFKLPFYVYEAITAIVKWLAGIDWGGIFRSIGEAFGRIWDSIKNAAVNAFNYVKGINWGEILVNVGKGLANAIIDLINGAMKGAMSGVPILKDHVPQIPHFASGVENFAGGLALVGERGPELVNLPRGADVIPNNRLGGTSITMNINLAGVMASSRADLRTVAKDLIGSINEELRAKGQMEIAGGLV